MKDTKKVKSFRMSEKTEYKLKVLSKQWGMGTGKYLENLINKEYLKWISGPRVVYNKQIIDAEWITPDHPEDR